MALGSGSCLSPDSAGSLMAVYLDLCHFWGPLPVHHYTQRAHGGASSFCPWQGLGLLTGGFYSRFRDKVGSDGLSEQWMVPFVFACLQPGPPAPPRKAQVLQGFWRPVQLSGAQPRD